MKDMNGDIAGALLYHDVDNNPEGSGFSGKDADLYKLSVEKFGTHLKALSLNHPVVSAPFDLVSPRPNKTIIFTFDDGGVSAVTNIAPMLEQYGWRGLFFIVTDKIGEPGFLTAEQIRNLQERGHVIGSHSHTHPMRFAALGKERILNEWIESRRILEEVTGNSVFTASVPGGFYSLEVAHLANQAGFKILFNSEPSAKAYSVKDMLVIGRFGIQMHTSEKEVLDLAFDRGFLRLRQSFYWNFKKVIKKIGGKSWINFRKWILNKT